MFLYQYISQFHIRRETLLWEDHISANQDQFGQKRWITQPLPLLTNSSILSLIPSQAAQLFFISVPLKQTKTSLHYEDWWISYFFLFVSLSKHHNQWQIHFTPCSFFWFTMALRTSLEETRQSNLIDSLVLVWVYLSKSNIYETL